MMRVAPHRFLSPFLQRAQSCCIQEKSLLRLYCINFSPLLASKLLHRRCYSSQSKRDESLTNVEQTTGGGEVSTTVHKVKEATKTASYLGVILVGVGMTGIIFYAVFKELFSSNSSNSVYSKALSKCREDPRVTNAIGDGIKGYGEETRRGRRLHVSHAFFERDGVEHLRMRFYIQGCRKKATVNLEMKKNDSGNFDYRYLFVQLDDYPHEVIILEDNRFPKSAINVPSPSLEFDLSKF